MWWSCISGNAPKGALLVTKVSDDGKNTPLSGWSSSCTDSTGSVIGNANGKYVTDPLALSGGRHRPGTALVVKETRPSPFPAGRHPADGHHPGGPDSKAGVPQQTSGQPGH